MGIHIGQLRIFIERILFQIQTRRIDVGTKDIHSFFHWEKSDIDKHHRFALCLGINLTAVLQQMSAVNNLFQRNIAVLPCR